MLVISISEVQSHEKQAQLRLSGKTNWKQTSYPAFYLQANSTREEIKLCESPSQNSG